MDKNFEIFIVNMSALNIESSIHPSQIVQIVVMQWDKASTKVLTEYADYTDVFF